jgi:hypothetical protein
MKTEWNHVFQSIDLNTLIYRRKVIPVSYFPQEFSKSSSAQLSNIFANFSKKTRNHSLGWPPTKLMSVLCRKTDTILSVFVGFSVPTETDTKKLRNRHRCRFFVGFLSDFCWFWDQNYGFQSHFWTKIFTNVHFLFCKMTVVALRNFYLTSWSINYI